MFSVVPRKSRFKLPPLDTGPDTFGQRLANIRKRRGYTQTEIAEKIGINQDLISDYEHDKLRMHAELVVRFALALEVSADELLGLKNGLKSKPAVPPKIRRRMQSIAALKLQDQRALLKTIDKFLKASE